MKICLFIFLNCEELNITIHNYCNRKEKNYIVLLFIYKMSILYFYFIFKKIY